ncbi:MAG: hypothetical protein H7831_10590 [Magnetococcus sp. WYHC-3]
MSADSSYHRLLFGEPAASAGGASPTPAPGASSPADGADAAGPTTDDTSLFRHYGALLLEEIQPGKLPLAPFSFFPPLTTPLTPGGESGDAFGLVSLIDEETRNEIIDAVELLRRHLIQEPSAGQTPPGGESVLPISRFRDEFARAVQSGNEEGLTDNPFYQLMRLLIQANLGALQRHFAEELSPELQAPGVLAIPVYPGLRELWRLRGRGIPWWRLGLQAVFKALTDVKLVLAVVLFVVSSFTTFQGANELLQLPWSAQWFGDLFQGMDGEGARYVASITLGVLLSSAILDYKQRLFQGMAEARGVFRGVYQSYARHPRWMVLATALVFVSIWTNYDGIVTLVSKQGDLARQANMIEARIQSVLGDPLLTNPDRPVSLHGLSMALIVGVEQAMDSLRRVPDDELKGLATSSDPRKGPRYWAKNYVVFGGYSPGVNDLPRLYVNNAPTRAINDMLADSGMDLTLGAIQRIEMLRDRYLEHFQRTQRACRDRTLRLQGLMRLESYAPSEVRNLLSLEHYQINHEVRGIVDLLEENKQVYDEVVGELNEVIDTHVDLLRRVDRFGSPGRNNYEISANMEVPPLEAIDALKKGTIPIAAHKTLEELKEFLVQEYGVALAGLILGGILTFAVSADLGDILLFSFFTARLARRDDRISEDIIRQQTAVDAAITSKVYDLFNTPHVQRIIPDLPRPSRLLIRVAVFHWRESAAELLMPASESGGLAQLWMWFRELFSISRPLVIQGLNAWWHSSRVMAAQPQRGIVDLLDFIYPQLSTGRNLKRYPIRQWNRMLLEGIGANRQRFAGEMERLRRTENAVDEPSTVPKLWKALRWRRRDNKSLSRTLQALESQVPTPAEPGGGTHALASGSLFSRLSSPADHAHGTHSQGPLGATLRALARLVSALYRRFFATAFLGPADLYPNCRAVWQRSVLGQASQLSQRTDFITRNRELAQDLFTRLPSVFMNALFSTEEILAVADGDWAMAFREQARRLHAELGDIENEVMRILRLGVYDLEQWLDAASETKQAVAEVYSSQFDAETLARRFTVLSEQADQLKNQVEETHGRVQKRESFIGEIESLGSEIERLIMQGTMASLSEGRRDKRWQLLGGGQLFSRVSEETKRLQTRSRQLTETSGDPSRQELLELEAASRRLHELRQHLLEVVSVLETPIRNAGRDFPRLSRPGEGSLMSLGGDGEADRAPSLRPQGEMGPESAEVVQQVRELFPVEDHEPSEGEVAKPGATVTGMPRIVRQSRRALPSPLKPLLRTAPQGVRSASAQGGMPAPVSPLPPVEPVVERPLSPVAAQPAEIPPSSSWDFLADVHNMLVSASAEDQDIPIPVPEADAALQHPQDAEFQPRDERVGHAMRATFISGDGRVFQGRTLDISISGVRMTADRTMDQLQVGLLGTFHMDAFAAEPPFPCRIVRVSGVSIILEVINDTTRFGLVVMQELFSRYGLDMAVGAGEP